MKKQIVSCFAFLLMITQFLVSYAACGLQAGRCDVTLDEICPPPSLDESFITEPLIDDFESGKHGSRWTNSSAFIIKNDSSETPNKVMAINNSQGEILLEEKWRNLILSNDVKFTDYGILEWSFARQDSSNYFNQYYILKENDASKLIVPKGIYYFDTPKRIDVKGFTDFEIDAQGSEFILGQVTQFMCFENNLRVVFKNATIDWDWQKERIADLIKISAKDAGNSWIELEYIGTDKVNANDIKLNHIQAVDPITYSRGKDGGNDIFGILPIEKKNISDNVVRITMTDTEKFADAKVGDVFLTQYYTYEGHSFPCFSNKHFTIDNIKIYSNVGSGFTMYGDTEYWQIINSTIGKRPGFEVKHPGCKFYRRYSYWSAKWSL